MLYAFNVQHPLNPQRSLTAVVIANSLREAEEKIREKYGTEAGAIYLDGGTDSLAFLNVEGS